MDFMALFAEYFVAVVVLGCCGIGYLLKHSFDMIPNKFIPTILAIVGIILNLLASGVSLESVIYGMMMGLASTGLHQAFTRFVEQTTE